MITAIYTILLILYLFFLGFAVNYNLFLSIGYFFLRNNKELRDTIKKHKRIAVIVPAHNEELLALNLCENLTQIEYPKDLYKIHIIADNCSDGTADICKSFPFQLLIRKSESQKGKGYALKWAFDNIDLVEYDAVLIVDADTFVKPDILKVLSMHLFKGENAIQCYIEVPNRRESWFTQIVYVSRTINNLLYHYTKYKLGLTSYLMGSGMCFSTELLKQKNWDAFSLAEDWEYFARLIEEENMIHFAVDAIVFQMESRSIKQATSQRLRWSSGRFHIVKKLGLQLLINGFKKKNIVMIDASLCLLLPNLSMQINLTIIAIVLYVLMANTLGFVFVIILIEIISAQAMMITFGIYLSGQYLNVLSAILRAPIFLLWKLSIDFVSITGIYKGKKWVRTKRHIPKSDK